MDRLQPVASFLGLVDILFLVITEVVAELLVVDPLLLEAEVEHGEGRVSCHLTITNRVSTTHPFLNTVPHLLVNIEELW